MVRTYAYNPSMQCAENAPLPGAKSSLLPLPARGTSTLFRNANIRTPGGYERPESGTSVEKEAEKDFGLTLAQKTPRHAVDSNGNPNINGHYSTNYKRVNKNAIALTTTPSLTKTTTTMLSPSLRQLESRNNAFTSSSGVPPPLPSIVEHATTLLGKEGIILIFFGFVDQIEHEFFC